MPWEFELLAFVVEWCDDAGFVVAGTRKYSVDCFADKCSATVVVELEIHEKH